jgi:hypothetical protein
MSTQPAAPAPREPVGCAGGLWLMIKLPFMILKAVPWFGEVLRQEAATTTGQRALEDACLYCHAPRADAQAGWRLDRNYLVVEPGGQ